MLHLTDASKLLHCSNTETAPGAAYHVAHECSKNSVKMHADVGLRKPMCVSHMCRTRQTFVGVRQAFPDENFGGVQVSLRDHSI